MSDVEEMKVPHDELCDQALEHYREISNQAMHSNSLVPAAIEYYRKWKPTGERKTVHTPGSLMTTLKEGWVFDPWLNPRGGPITIGELPYEEGVRPTTSVYWVLVKGTPEQIAALEPFVELAVEEESEPEFKPYGLETMFISHGEKDSSGAPKKPPKGFVIMHKDHIYAKGTVYTLRPSEEETSLKAPQPTSSP